jgi:hypothetical protein
MFFISKSFLCFVCFAPCPFGTVRASCCGLGFDSRYAVSRKPSYNLVATELAVDFFQLAFSPSPTMCAQGVVFYLEAASKF